VKKTKIKPPPNWEDTPQSFERFERLAKALVAVPKKELDKELAKDARKKRQKAPKESQ
jgi:hypothetical protein